MIQFLSVNLEALLKDSGLAIKDMEAVFKELQGAEDDLQEMSEKMNEISEDFNLAEVIPSPEALSSEDISLLFSLCHYPILTQPIELGYHCGSLWHCRNDSYFTKTIVDTFIV